jgi:hypothetical protein
MTSRFFALLLLVVPMLVFSQGGQTGVVNNTNCTFWVTFYPDNGTACTPATATSICVAANSGPTTIANLGAGIDNCYFIVYETDPGCANTPANCYGPTHYLGFPSGSCANYSGYPDFKHNITSNCPGCTALNPTYDLDVLFVSGSTSDFILTIN